MCAVSFERICMIRTESVTRRFGTPATSHLRKTEWKRLGVFLAFGLAAFLFAVVGASFVPLGLPDTLRRWAHPTIFVPLGTLVTALMQIMGSRHQRDLFTFRIPLLDPLMEATNGGTALNASPGSLRE